MSSDRPRNTLGHPLYQSHPSSESPPPQYSQPDLTYELQRGHENYPRPSHDSSTRGNVHYNASVASDADQTYLRSRSSSSIPSIDRTTVPAFGDGKGNVLRRKMSSRFNQRQVDGYHGKPGPKDRTRPSRKIGGRVVERPSASMRSSLPLRPREKPRQEMRGLEQAASVWRWTGGRGGRPQAWGKLAKDPELWDPTGDTLIYFSPQRPTASFRIKSSVLEETESEFFITLLREGYKGKKSYGFSGDSGSPPPSQNPSSSQPLGHVRSQASVDDGSSLFKKRRAKVFGGSKKRDGSIDQPTPPLSTSSTAEKEATVLYEVYLPAPPEASRIDILRHHLTTRNVLALLLNKPIVGLNLYQALIDLHTRLQVYLPPDMDCASIIIDYLETNNLVDVRYDPAAAAGLLAWSEENVVQWHEGWREAFVHCAGMYNRLTSLPEFRDVSQVSRALLEHSHLELSVRIQDAGDRLATFNFDDVWPVQSTQSPLARTSFDRLRRFLKQFYEAKYRNWPPRATEQSETGWLTRGLVQSLQKDFGAVYDYFVDRDVTWSEVREGSKEKARIISKTNRATFRADSDNLPMTDYLNGFDTRNHCDHIPHPYPLLPTSMPVQFSPKSSFFGSKKVKGLDKKTAFAYSEASNVFLLGSDFPSNDLLEAFLKFEKTDQVGEIDPLDARKGRWILLYCILQILAGVSIDTPNIWCKDNVSYFLSARLKGTPPWDNSSDPVFQQASRKQSHCWTVPRTWAQDHATIGWSGLRNHKQIVITSGGIGDGTGRVAAASPDVRNLPLERQSSHSSEEEIQTATDGDAATADGVAYKGQESKMKEWPVQGLSPPPKHGATQSGFVAPSDW